MLDGPEHPDAIPLYNLVAEAHKKRRRRYTLRELLFWLGHLFSSGYGVLMLQGLATVMAYFLAIVLVPFEIAKLIVQVEDQIQKEVAWYVIAGTIVGGVITLAYFAGNTAVKWGSASPIATTIVAVSPPVFTALFGLMAIASGVSFWRALKKHTNHSELTTPIKKFGLVTKGANTACLVVMAAFIMPYMLIPHLSAIFLATLLTAFAVMLVIKVVKAIFDTVQWHRTLKKLGDKEDPYDLFFSPKEKAVYINKLAAEADAKKNSGYLDKFIGIFMNIKNKLLGIENPDSAASFIKKIFENKMASAAGNPAEEAKWKELFQLLSRTRGRAMIDKRKEEKESHAEQKSAFSLPVIITPGPPDTGASRDGKPQEFFPKEKIPNDRSGPNLGKAPLLVSKDKALKP